MKPVLEGSEYSCCEKSKEETKKIKDKMRKMKLKGYQEEYDTPVRKRKSPR